jgi:NitT/TauT family transport system substrate-binding protein
LKVVVLPYTSYGPFFIAQEEGYFAEQSLTVEFTRFESGTAPMPILIQGDIDVLGSGPNVSLFNAIAQGSNLKIVADKGYLASVGCTYMALLATPAWIERYNASPEEALRGARVSIDPTNFEAFMFTKVLTDAGLTFDDVIPQDIAPPSLAEAVQNDAVDIISIGDPWITRLLDTGLVTIWKPYQEIVPDMQFGVVLFGPSLLDQNPELGSRFMTAYLKGVAQYNTGKTDRNLEIMAQYTELAVELLQRACWPPMNETGMISTTTVDEFQNWALSKDLLDEVIPVDSYWDPTFVQQVIP